MLRSGKDYLEALKDGRDLYIGGERVDDVTTHPAFQGAAQTFASLFDMKADPANADVMSFEDNGERFAMYYLMPRSADDSPHRHRTADCSETAPGPRGSSLNRWICSGVRGSG